eukprot:CAMPEP_0170456876 /NCGR_PEP_ID=MMETSP0123-20130129/4359_1 /TAXON_ID=182087 /ORGANISM="Favella ehrenbergii, Strain Fehren 1" /LENGTH=64 /DNA_ID=CAMNT_0010720489 /DNA_START=874 /DNA_END=1068 /DNA_ORIENTATION=+
MTLNFMDKVYIESTHLHDIYMQQQAEEEANALATAEAEKSVVVPIVPAEVPVIKSTSQPEPLLG